MWIVVLQFLLFVIALSVCSFFSFTETAFTSMRLYKIQELQQRYGSGLQDFFRYWVKEPGQILISILVTQNFFNTIGSVVISRILEDSLGGVGLIVGVLLSTLSFLLFGDIIPKSLAKAHGHKHFAKVLIVLSYLVQILFWPIKVLLLTAKFIVRLVGLPELHAQEDAVCANEVEFLIQTGDQQGSFGQHSGWFLRNIIALPYKSVGDVMVPVAKAFSLSAATTAAQAKHLFLEAGFSRAPVWSGSELNIVGMVLFKDVVQAEVDRPLDSIIKIMRPVLSLQVEQRIDEVLPLFLHDRMHFGVVRQQGVVGILTLEDLLEQVVGQIQGERELSFKGVELSPGGGFDCDGLLSMATVGELFGCDFGLDSKKSVAQFVEGLLLDNDVLLGAFVANHGLIFSVKKVINKRIVIVQINKQ